MHDLQIHVSAHSASSYLTVTQHELLPTTRNKLALSPYLSPSIPHTIHSVCLATIIEHVCWTLANFHLFAEALKWHPR